MKLTEIIERQIMKKDAKKEAKKFSVSGLSKLDSSKYQEEFKELIKSYVITESIKSQIE